MRRLLLLAAGVTLAAAFVGLGVGRAATALTVGSGWQQFNWVGQTQPVVPSQTPYTFTTTSKVTLSITDIGCPGEVFTVYDNGVLLGRTTAPTLTSCSYANATNDPSTALEDETYSGGIATLPKGTHSITIVVSTAPYADGSGFIRIDEALQFETKAEKKDARTLARKKFFT